MDNKTKESSSIKIEESAMAVVLCQGHILMTKELIYGNEKISLPKGHIEKGETKVEAAIRECHEETGILLNKETFRQNLKPFSVDFTDDNDGAIRKTISPLLFILKEEKTSYPQEKNILFAGFVPVSEFLKVGSYENVKDVVREAVEIIQ